MVFNLSTIELETEYRSLREDPVSNFYQPCLANSVNFKRASGYFKSTIYSVVGPTVVGFAKGGGRIQLICSPQLDIKDVTTISRAIDERDNSIATILISEIDNLLDDSSSAYNLRVLATLIKCGALEIKIAIRADRKGLYHEKIGIFSDNVGNQVSFRGSANETWSGWHRDGNFESIEVFCSWDEGRENERVEKHVSHFDSMWSERDEYVEVFPFPAHAVDHLLQFSLSDLNEINLDGFELVPKKRKPFKHQREALEGWRQKGKRGIFKHATGTGKTFTAILAIEEHVNNGNTALVLVPDTLLLKQWAGELKSEFPNSTILLAGGGNTRWKRPHRLEAMTSESSDGSQRIVLSTMQTASQPSFLSRVQPGDHLLIVVDEVHQLGSTKHSRAMSIDAAFRLGLSATPERYGDPDGTQKILDYFEGIVPPEISLTDAIKAGRLVEYEYYATPIHLSATEADDWKKFTIRIRNEFARSRSNDEPAGALSDKVKMLLIQRSRIAKKAIAKIEVGVQIFKTHYTKGQHWLIYCEDIDHLNQIIDRLREDGFEPLEYHSQMTGDKEETLEWFTRYGGPLVSIRCLDQGVDIPAISHALILASSQNPRQFIQRRGRVLRRAPDKYLAKIYDTIVVPTSLEKEPEQTSLLQAELVRAIEFADNAINKTGAAELHSIAINLGVELDDFKESGYEVEVGSESA